jgi:3-dehydroquinate dehydratase
MKRILVLHGPNLNLLGAQAGRLWQHDARRINAMGKPRNRGRAAYPQSNMRGADNAIHGARLDRRHSD